MQPTPPPVGAIVVQQLDFMGIIFLAMVGGSVVMLIIYALIIKLKSHGATIIEEWDPDGDQLVRYALVKADSFNDANVGVDKQVKANTAISKKAMYWPPGVPWFLQERLSVSSHLKGIQEACCFDNRAFVDYKAQAKITAMEARAKSKSKTREMFARVSKAWLQKNKESLVVYALVAIIGVGMLVGYNTYLANKSIKTIGEVKAYIGELNQPVEGPAPTPIPRKK